MTIESHESYFASVEGEAKFRLQAIQSTVETLLPDVTKCFSYNMPAFRDKRIFLYFAAFKKHIGIYPPVRGDERLIQELAPYRGPKGNLIFPLNQALPIALIERVILALHKEYGGQ